MNDALRQTGRTTRLIEKAVHQASCGFAVYLVMPTQNLARLVEPQVQATWDRLWPGRGPHGIKVEWLSSGSRDLGSLHNFSWREMRVPSAHPNAVFLVDHYLIEQRIQGLQAEMARLAEDVARLYPLTV